VGLTLRRRRQPASAEIVTAETEAAVRLADAELARSIRARDADLGHGVAVKRAADEDRDRAEKREKAKRKAKAKARRKAKAKRKQRRTDTWQATKARFSTALGGRLVAVLVVLAAATAWYGQYRHLSTPTDPPPGVEAGLGAPLLIAVAGATALETFGLAMFNIARRAGARRERAVRARLLGWSVIAFSAWSNLQHMGAVPAALSVVGPLAWEVHEWWRHREVLHDRGALQARPVRPRFPLDQIALFPVRSLAAYRVAVRDRIESPDEALAVARAEAQARSAARRARRARGWLRVIRAVIGAAVRSRRPARPPRAEKPSMRARSGPDRTDPIASDQQRSGDRVDRGRFGWRRWRKAEADPTADPIVADDAQPRAVGSGSDRTAAPTEPQAATVRPAADPDPTRTVGPDPIPPRPEPTAVFPAAPSRSVEQLLAEADRIIAAERWDPATVSADRLRIALKCRPTRAREVRDRLRARAATAIPSADT
jgi:hypothetical protein